MKRDIAERWVAKLRDPAVRQGRSMLGNVNGLRCCLGVLCDIAVEDDVINPPEPSLAAGRDDPMLRYDTETSLLPESVVEWAGMRSKGGRYPAPSCYMDNALFQDNDNGMTFAEIASIIERYVEEL